MTRAVASKLEMPYESFRSGGRREVEQHVVVLLGLHLLFDYDIYDIRTFLSH